MSDQNLFDVRDILYSAEKPEESTEEMKTFEDKVVEKEQPSFSEPDLDNSELPEELKEDIIERVKERDMEEHGFITDAAKPTRNPLLDNLAAIAGEEPRIEESAPEGIAQRFETVVKNVLESSTVEAAPSNPLMQTVINTDPKPEVDEVGDAHVNVESTNDFFHDIKEAEKSFDEEPIVLGSIKDTQGVIKSRVEKLGIDNAPLEMLFNKRIVNTIESIEGYSLYTIFGNRIAMKDQIRRELVDKYVKEIKDTLAAGKTYSLNLKSSCVAPNENGINVGTYDTILLNRNEIAYICNAFQFYNARLDSDAEMKDSLYLYVG